MCTVATGVDVVCIRFGGFYNAWGPCAGIQMEAIRCGLVVIIYILFVDA